MKLYLDHLAEYKAMAIDTETTGLNWKKDTVFGIAVAAWDGKSVASGYWDVRETPRIIEALNDQMRKSSIPIVNHHIKFDVHMLREAGVRVPLDRIQCTQTRAALINENEGHNGRDGFDLDSLCRKYIGRGKEIGVYDDLAAMFGGKAERKVQMKNLHRAPSRLAAKYATPDPELALLLWLWQEEEIKRQKLEKIWGLERELTPVLCEIEQGGVRVDGDRATKSLAEMSILIDKAQRSLDKIAGRPINANSPKQVRELFGAHKRDDGKWYTDGGIQLLASGADNPSFDKDALEIIEKLDPRAKAIQTLRKMTKGQQFLKDHILGHMIGDRVYPNYNQTRGENGLGVGPGRFSINDPALQQIPARDVDVAAIVRSCFLPEKGEVWSCADWEQFEFRWFAHYTNDPTIVKAYADDPNTDYHQIVADITGIPRNATHAGAANAKQINLGLVFGMGEGEMAYQMGLDYTMRTDERGREWKNAGPRAKEVFATYHGAIPGVNKLKEQASSIARARGFVKTVLDRHIRFPGGKFTHKAAGLVFQGTSADCMKLKMIALHKIGKQYGFRYLLSVHDENDNSLPKKDVKKLVPVIKKELEAFGESDPIFCRVPILCSIKTGDNWWEACKKD